MTLNLKSKSIKKKKTENGSATKAEKKRGISSFLIFRNERRLLLKEKNVDIPLTEQSRLIAAEWHKLSADEKQVYSDLAKMHNDGT